MDPITLNAFDDELEKIASIHEELRDPRLYSNLRHSFKSSEERVRLHKKLKRGDGTVLDAMRKGFGNSAEKTAASNAALIGGALGAGGTLVSGGLKEWDTRHVENQHLRRTPAEHKDEMKHYIQANRRHRAARLAVRAGVLGAAGAGAGHALHKGAVHLTDAASEAASKNLKKGFGEAIEESVPKAMKSSFNRQVANEVGEGFGEGVKKGTTGGGWNLFPWRRKKP